MKINYIADGTVAYLFNALNNTTTAFNANTLSFLCSDLNHNGDAFLQMDGELMLNFPTTLRLEKIGIRAWHTYSSKMHIYYSTNSVEGKESYLDTAYWTEITSSQLPHLFQPKPEQYIEFDCGNVDVKWIRILNHEDGTTNGGLNYNNILIFGEYQSPKYEFYNEAGTAELTGDHPLQFYPAYNAEDYLQTQTFKIKNLDTGSHSYKVDLNTFRYQGDTFVFNESRGTNNIVADSPFNLSLNNKIYKNEIPTMTNNTTPSGVASASSLSQNAYYAFCGTASSWDSGSTTFPQWLQYKFPSGLAICSYKMKIDQVANAAATWELWASNTGAFTGEEVKLHEITSAQTWDQAYQTKSWSFNNTTTYTYYRLKILTVVNLGSSSRVFRLQLSQSQGTDIITTPSVSANSLSPTIYLHANIPAASNPADGTHYFTLDVTPV